MYLTDYRQYDFGEKDKALDIWNEVERPLDLYDFTECRSMLSFHKMQEYRPDTQVRIVRYCFEWKKLEYLHTKYTFD